MTKKTGASLALAPAASTAVATAWPADKVERRAVAKLVPYARNARTHSPEQVAQIAASIDEWGWTTPILVDEAGGLLCGHGRVLAAQLRGIETVPCMVATGWTEAQKRAYILADNKLALNAGWDDALLKLELGDLGELGFDLGLIGFSDDDLRVLAGDNGVDGNTHPDDVPPVPETPASVTGDVWVLGSHRVAVGDSTVLADVDRAVGGDLVDALWTDPPYNVNYSGSAGKIANDNMKDAAFRAFLLDALVAGFAVMKPGAPAYIAHADTEGLNFRAAFQEAGFKLSGCLIWRKNSLVLGRSDYQWQHEPILYGWRPGAAHTWYGGRKNTTLAEFAGDLVTDNGDGTFTLRMGSEMAVISGENLQLEKVEPTVFSVEKPRASKSHPTMKPVELIQRMLRNSTRPGDLVLDLFGGSGSTLIACETLGRQCRMVELDPKFADVIVLRWEAFTGKSATLEADGRTFSEARASRTMSS